MGRKGKLFGLLAIFAAISLITATGAFSTVTATRTATVNVAGDSGALLAMQPHPGPNGYGSDNGGTMADSNGYAQITNDQLEVNLAGYNSEATGVNPNAVTDIESVFIITNQGTQAVVVGVTNLPNSMSIYTDDSQLDYIQAQSYNSSSLNQDNYSPSSGNLPVVGVGETMDDVGVIFRDPPSNLSDTSITFNAIALSQTSLGYTPP